MRLAVGRWSTAESLKQLFLQESITIRCYRSIACSLIINKDKECFGGTYKSKLKTYIVLRLIFITIHAVKLCRTPTVAFRAAKVKCK